MKRAEIADELDEWFDVSRYDALNELTLEQIYVELERRMIAYKALQQWATLDEKHRMLAVYHEAMIKTGKVLHEGRWLSDRILASSYAVKPLKRDSLFSYARATLHLEDSTPKDEISVNSEYVSEYLQQGKLNPSGKMLIEIDLSEASSDDIVEHLKTLVPQWKKQMNASEPPEKDYRFGHKTFRKILDYKIIPLMDLIYWEEVNDVKIPYSLLAPALHPDKRYARGSEQIKATDYPLAANFLNDDSYFKSLNDFFIKNSHVKNSKISDVIKMNDKPEPKKG
ncbi:DUF6387 family protein [Pectobacterium colocasium]|uniref:DUF6387 family protein n=1 Tax=Pectobacterium colocasium TaxID=2878098 RepID=UPI001CD4FEEC|nr:DUF6387 family protein [Pectobacterium colocasium]